MNEYCPNAACGLLFASLDDVAVHISDPRFPCGAAQKALRKFGFDSVDDVNDGEDGDDCEDSTEPAPWFESNMQNVESVAPAPESQSLDGSTSDLSGLFTKVYHPNCAQSKTGGQNLLQAIHDDCFADRRKENPFYPFADKTEWELVKWMIDASLMQQQIDTFLKLGYVKRNPLSLKSARDMRKRIEMLPAVPRWKHQTLKAPAGIKSKTPIVLYWRNPLEVVKELYRNPIFSSCLEHNPYRLYPVFLPEHHIFSGFMSGEFAWDYQTKLEPGNTFAGIILASDKTPLTTGTGDKEMHPVLLSIANIDAGVHMKATSRAFALIAYLPVVQFADVTEHEQSILKAQLFHFCMDIILEPLKVAEREGEMMSDAAGLLRVVHTPLEAWLADYPEQQLVACVSGNQSPVTTAVLENFGDMTEHSPRTRVHTLSAIQEVFKEFPDGFNTGQTLEPFWQACQHWGINGVESPFWKDWGAACPSIFLTHDALHGLHKFFWDHVVDWAVNIMTGPELDACLKSIQPRVGVRHWAQGVSELKQVTGSGYRELEKVFIAAINGGVDPPVMQAMRSLLDFIFISQSLLFSEETLDALSDSLHKFHLSKESILKAGGRRGKNGRINHFHIPKLEMLHVIARSTRLLGAPYQWTTDITERCHITHVKAPYKMSNRRNFHPQCIRYMDRVEKINVFDLFTALVSNEANLLNDIMSESNNMANHYPEQMWLSQVLPEEEAVSYRKFKARTDLFGKKTSLISDDEMTAIYLNINPHIRALSVHAIADQYNIPDLRGALGDYFSQVSYQNWQFGQRQSQANCSLPISTYHVWHNLRLQHRSFQDSRILAPHQTVQALPPNPPKLPFGRCDTVLISGGYGELGTTFSALGGCHIIQIRAILQPVLPNANANAHPLPHLIYGEFFEFSADYTTTNQDGTTIFTPVPGIGMFEVHRRKFSNGRNMGHVVPLDQILQAVELIPKHGLRADPRWNCDNSLEGNSFYLNDFSNKENFHAILSYQ